MGGGDTSLQPSLSDSEGSSEEGETEGGPTSQDDAAALETSLRTGTTLCSTPESERLSEPLPSLSGTSGVLSQDKGRMLPSETSFPLLSIVESPDACHNTGQSNEGSCQREDDLLVQGLHRGDGEVGTGGSEEVQDDSGTDEDGDSEGSSSFPSVGLQTLSLQTKAYQPLRDNRRTDSTDSKSSSVTATSYVQGDQARMRQLVKRTVAKKRKQQHQKQQSRPKKDAASATTRRSKKASRRAVRQDDYDFW